MFVCLFKKVTIHKTLELSIVQSNNNTNILALGGDEGFLKVIQIDLVKPKTNLDGTPASPVTFSQTLITHRSRIELLTWNDQWNKLTTCDTEGVIVVWKFGDNSQWETEMINNRDISVVSDIKWSPMGNYLCFIYEDGHAIVGTAEGSRSWGNDIVQNSALYRLEWSPDETFILFCSENHHIIIFSTNGYQLGEMQLPGHLITAKISDITWWTNPLIEQKTIVHNKHLAVIFDNGTILLYDSHQDLNPFEIKTELSKVKKAQWSPNGETLAICGTITEENEIKDCLTFYSSSGQYVQDIKLSNKITSFTWESYGAKIAITTETFLLFCLIKPDYKWTYFSDTLVYSYMNDSEHHTIVFWDLKKNKKNYKYVKNLLNIKSSGAFCLLTAKASESKYVVILCNSIGSPVDSRVINIYPEYTAMNNTHIFIASNHHVYIWQFRYENNNFSSKYGNKLNTDLLNKDVMKEIAFFIEEVPNLKEVYSLDNYNVSKTTNDLICSIYSNDKGFLVCCETGRTFIYDLPLMVNPERYYLDTKLIKSGLSPNLKYAWGIDDMHYFSIWDITKDSNKGKVGSILKGEKLDFEKSDVWNVVWSSDNEECFAFMQKNILNIHKGLTCEEVLNNNGYLAEYKDLSISTIMLEELLIKPSTDSYHKVEDIYVICETRILRDLRDLITEDINIADIYSYCERHNNEKLWDILTEHTMIKLDFVTAEKCLVRKQDYIGLSLLKRIQNIEEDDFKKAEVYQHYFKYDLAEEIYKKKDRNDLLIDMRIKLGHWEKVIELINESSIIEEDNLKVALNNLALQYIEKKEYDKAEELLLKTGNREELINVWFITENFHKASEYIDNIPEESEFLLFMGEKFELYGLTQEAVRCYIRYGDIKKAIDICVLTNQWNLAVELAEKNNLFQVEGLVVKFEKLLIEKNKKMDLVEFYRKAHKHTEAAKILIKIAEELKANNTSPIILKKIYVLAALEMESYKTRYMDAQITNTMTTMNNAGTNNTNTATNKTLDTLITSDLSNLGDKSLNNPWKGAEAIHYYMLCQSQIYNKEYNSALKTSLRLVQFEKELSSKDVYRLITLAALLNGSLKECSNALAKLKNLQNITDNEKVKFDELSFSIFTKNKPLNKEENKLKCPGKDCDEEITEYDIDCKSCGSNFSACIVSGQSLFFKEYIKCRKCKHKSLCTEVVSKRIRHCLMCHTKLNMADKSSNIA